MKPTHTTALSALISFVMLTSTALAVTPVQIQSDLVKMGRPASSADKVLEFNGNQGANNPKVIVPVATPLQVNVTADTVKLGKTTAANKKIILDAAAGAANPAIQWDNTAGKLQFSNNGVDFKSIGAGSGGAGGINLLQDANPDFEAGTTGWTASGGSFTVATSGANLLVGTRSAVFDSSAAAQTVTSTAITITSSLAPGLAGGNGFASCLFKGSAVDYKVQAWDGSNVLAERVIPALTSAQEIGVAFPMPTSGTIAVRVISQSDAVAVAVDDCYVGSFKPGVDLSQAALVGTITYPVTAGCNWSTTATVLTSYAAQASCPTPTVTGNVSAPGTKIPGVVLNSVAPGNYYFVTTSNFTVNTSGISAAMNWAYYDGSSNFGDVSALAMTGGTSNFTQSNVLIGQKTYSAAQSNLTVQIQGKTSNASNDALIQNSSAATGSAFVIMVYRFPTTAEQALRVDTVGQTWNGYISGVTSGWARTSATQGDFSAGVGTVVTNTLSATNMSAPTVLSGPLPGITFTPGTAGVYQVCATSNMANSVADNMFAYLTDASGVVYDYHSYTSSNSNFQTTFHMCGNFPATSTAPLSVKVQGSSTTGTLTLASLTNPRVMHWSIQKLAENIPAPLLVGSVTSNSAGLERVERAKLSNSGSCAVLSQSGSWISSVSDPGTGLCGVSFSASVFSGAPACTCITTGATVGVCTQSITATSAGVTIKILKFDSISPANLSDGDLPFDLVCMGPR